MRGKEAKGYGSPKSPAGEKGREQRAPRITKRAQNAVSSIAPRVHRGAKKTSNTRDARRQRKRSAMVATPRMKQGVALDRGFDTHHRCARRRARRVTYTISTDLVGLLG